MTKHEKIPAIDEAWETGQLGRDGEYAKIIQDDIESQIDEALDLQLISIRLQKSLIEDFKYIATLYGIGYQPLMRQVLWRFAECEKKAILRAKAAEIKAQAETMKGQASRGDDETSSRQRKTA